MLFSRGFSIGFLLLAVYLILIGLMGVTSSVTISPFTMGILALISGILIIIGI